MNGQDNGILCAYAIKESGAGVPISGPEVTENIKSDSLAWVHLDANSPVARSWLEREITYLDHIIIDALLAQETRPRFLEFQNGALIILRGVNLNKDADPEDMISLRIWIDSERIISLQRRNIVAVDEISKLLESGKGPKTSGDFLTLLLARFFNSFEDILGEMNDRLDDVEQEVMESPDPSDRNDITVLRKQAIIFKRYIYPQREILSQLRLCELKWLGAMHRRRIQETLDRVIRYIEDLEAIRDRAQIVKDELSNTLSDHLNKNLFVLSVITSIFLPLGFLTGLLGVNVAGIPGADSPYAFWVFVGILITVVIGQIIIFKTMKWF